MGNAEDPPSRREGRGILCLSKVSTISRGIFLSDNAENDLILSVMIYKGG